MVGFVIYYGIILLLLISFFISIPIFVFLRLKKIGLPIMGVISSFFILASFVFGIYYMFNEDKFFFKSDAREELQAFEIYLNDDFEIIRNESFGISDHYHVFELKISNYDEESLLRGFNEFYNNSDNIQLISKKENKELFKINLLKSENILLFEHEIF